MYDPIQDGIEKSTRSVDYTESKPPEVLSDVVHRFWELKSESVLVEDFQFHVLPDACVNILLDQKDPRIAGVTALSTTATTLNLGTDFHYVGIQLLPGVWQGNPRETADSFVGTPYVGELPLAKCNDAITGKSFVEKQKSFIELIGQLKLSGHIAPNPVTAKILANTDSITSVTDMAKLVAMSPRQLQRTLKSTTQFSPHDLLKILRLQQSFKEDYLDYFTDQSHYIRSFKEITGYTPASYVKKFNV